MIETIIGSIISPSLTFRKEIKNANWATSLILYLISFTILVLWSFLFFSTAPDLSMTLVTTAIQQSIGSFLFLLLFSFISGKLGGKGTFLELYYLSSLWILPFTIFGLLITFLQIYLNNFGLGIVATFFALVVVIANLLVFFTAIREVTKLSPRKAAVALFLVTIIFMLVVIFFVLISGIPAVSD